MKQLKLPDVSEGSAMSALLNEDERALRDMEESPVERYFRDAREAAIPEGTSQIQILHLGKALLGHSALR
jgi:hypothetical protein